MPELPGGRVHFKGLNGIRAVAALLITTSHVNLCMGLFGLEPRDYGLVGMAGLRVGAFFVLSGFLTTYLLLAEKARFGSIDRRRFHLRRILRIWPIYYLVFALSVVALLLGVALAPRPVPLTVGLYGLMLPNFAYALDLKWWVVAPLWSVGAMEQFFSFWPMVLDRASRVVRAMAGVIAVYIVVKLGLWLANAGALYTLVSMSAFDSMAIGGIAAVLVLRGSALLRWVYLPVVQAAGWAFVGWGLLVRPVHVASVIDAEIHAVVMAILILNVSTNPRSLVRLDHPVLDSLGRISYGVYAYNMLVTFVLAHLLKGHLAWAGTGLGAHLLVQALCGGAAIVVAHASRMWFEAPFLAAKARLARVPAER